MQQPLLSIIIPTKNRQMTAVYAVKTALLIEGTDIEIIVQDCSADDSLRQQLAVLNDRRIKYFYQNDAVSMTDNWNRAYGNAGGAYLIGIGDDDAVFPDIYTVAKWAYENQVEAVGQTEPFQYFWPNFPIASIQKRLFVKPFAGGVTEVTDLYERVKLRSKFCDDGYGIDLPMVYHRLISRPLLDKLRAATGKLLDATSLDVYSSFAIGLLCKQFVIVDYPFSMRGASGDSNSGRFVVKKDKQHFDEYKYVSYPEWMPRIPLVHVSIAESIYKAFIQTGHEELVSNISLPYLYAVCMVDRPGKSRYLLQFVKKYLKGPGEKKQFVKYYFRQGGRKANKSIRNWIEKVNMYIPLLSLYRKMIGKKVIRLENTMEVVDFQNKYIEEHNITLKLSLAKK